MKIHCLYDKLEPTGELKAHPKNRNQHPREQIERLAQILDYQGWRYAIKVSKQSGFITTGHGRRLSAMVNKWDRVPVVYQDYESEDQEYADVTADNAIASWAELDLSGINLDIPDLGPDLDINMLGLKDFKIDVSEKEGQDEVPVARPTTIQLGDLYTLGNHRLLCGDATDAEDVRILMNGEKADMVYTDPPYGIDLQCDKPIPGRQIHRKIYGDDKEFDPSHILELSDEIFLFGANYYCWHLPRGGSWICWDKRSAGEDIIGQLDGAFGSDIELVWSKQKHKMSIARVLKQTAVFAARGEDKQLAHPTQKPIALAEWFFERWGKDKTNIVDLYLGSGSTLIACEKTQRRCFGMEIDPQYCQVIIDRWEKFTGLKAFKL